MKRFCLLLLLCLVPLRGDAACRLALAMALDVSGSVDAEEYRLQMSGLAAALGDPDVEAALFSMPEAPVALSVFEWSSASYQRIIHDWILVEDRTVLGEIRGRLVTWEREKAPEATGLGAAMEFGKALLDRAPACWSQTLDVSGDGKNNDWPEPRYVRAQGTLAGIRINALVIAERPGSEGQRPPVLASDLADYFRANVIQGSDAFVEMALGFQDYATAMQRKLLRELKAQPVGVLPRRFGERIVPARLSEPVTDQ